MSMKKPFKQKVELLNDSMHIVIRKYRKKIFEDRKRFSESNSNSVVSFLIFSQENSFLQFIINDYCLKNVLGRYKVYDSLTAQNYENIQLYNFGVCNGSDSSGRILKQVNDMGIDKYFTTHPVIVKGKTSRIASFEDFVYYFVYLNTITKSKTVGEPIAVARLQNHIFEWRRNELNCP